MSRTYRLSYSRPVAPFDAVFVGSGINGLAGAALLARDGWRVCVLEREDQLGGCIRTSARADTPRLHARAPRSLASAVHRLWRVRRAEGRSRPSRGRVRQHRPADRDGVPGRLRSVRLDLARAKRRRRSTGSPPVTAPPGSDSSRRSWTTPTSPSGCCRPSSGRGRGLRSVEGRTGNSGERVSWRSRGERSSAVATG